MNFAERITIDPEDPSKLYVMGGNHDSLLQRSLDGGTTWEELYGDGSIGLRDLEMLSVGGVLFTATVSGVYRWTNGASSVERVLAEPVYELSTSESSVGTVWVLGPAGAWKSMDSGSTWTPIASPTSEPYTISLDVHPTNPLRALAAAQTKGAFVTSDGGMSWQQASGLPDAIVPVSIAYDPLDPRIAYVATGKERGGVWRSTNGGRSWTWSSSGLLAPCPQILFDPTVEGRVWVSRSAAYEGLGVPLRSTDGGASWQPTNLPFLTYRSKISDFCVSPTLSGRVYCIDADPVGAKVWRSLDAGDSWTSITPPYSLNDPELIVEALDGTLFVGSTGRLYRSADLGETWTPVLTGTTVYELVFDPSRPGVLHLIADTYRRSLDGGLTWTALGSGLPTNGPLFGIAIDPLDGKRLFVRPGVLLASDPGLYRSEDGGFTFAPVAPELTGIQVNAVAVDPFVPGRVLVATPANGYWRSEDFGATFSPVNEGLPDMQTMAVAFDPHSPGRAWGGLLVGGIHVWESP
jgi:photosystem II stability/assembly factor-like uncharacterized protein